MGLFDTIRCEYALPDPRLQGEEFQTKDLDPALEMAVRYGDLEQPPDPLPSGWAALLCLYGLR